MGIRLAELSDTEVEAFFENFMMQDVPSCTTQPAETASMRLAVISERGAAVHDRQSPCTEHLLSLLIVS
jgi:hypothetical protein